MKQPRKSKICCRMEIVGIYRYSLDTFDHRPAGYGHCVNIVTNDQHSGHYEDVVVG